MTQSQSELLKYMSNDGFCDDSDDSFAYMRSSYILVRGTYSHIVTNMYYIYTYQYVML